MVCISGKLVPILYQEFLHNNYGYCNVSSKSSKLEELERVRYHPLLQSSHIHYLHMTATMQTNWLTHCLRGENFPVSAMRASWATTPPTAVAKGGSKP